MSRVRQPTDEGGTVSLSVDGQATDSMTGGFPPETANDVHVVIDDYDWSIFVTADNPGAATGSVSIEYTLNGGSSWGPLSGSLHSVTAINGDSDSDSGVDDTLDVNIGTVPDLSQLDIRVQVTLNLDGADIGSGTATVTGWEISYQPPVGIIAEED